MFKTHTQKHWPAFILALLIGAATLLPQVFAVRAMGESFDGIYPQINNDELYYLARGQDVIDGHGGLSNPYLLEHKDGPALQFWIPDFLLANVSTMFGISVHQTYLWYDFFFPAILVLLTYGILFLLTENVLLSLSGALFLHAGMFLELFNRPVSPQFNFIFFLALFFSLIRFIQTKKTAWIVASTLLLGALFHVYTYYWTYFFVLLPIFLVLSFFVFRGQAAWKPYLVILLGAAVIGIPYFSQMLGSAKLPYYQETLARLGFIHTHFPSAITIVFWGGILVVAYLLFFSKKVLPVNRLSVFLFSAVLAAPIVSNQHVITGGNLEFSSHYYSLSVFVFVFAGAYLLQKIGEMWNGKWRKRFFRSIALLALLVSLPPAYHTVQAQMIIHPETISEERYGEIFRWLNVHTKKDTAIVSDNLISSLVPAYTHNNVLFAREANLHFMSDAEVVDRFILTHYTGVEFDEDFIRTHERSLLGTYFINESAHRAQENKLRRLLGMTPLPEVSPQKRINTILERYTELQGKSWRETLLASSYEADYLVWDTSTHPEWSITGEDGFTELFESEGVRVYAIK